MVEEEQACESSGKFRLSAGRWEIIAEYN